MVELMVALVLMTLVGGVTYQLLVNNQRVTRSQTEHVSMQDNVRSGALILGNELREVGWDAVTAPAVLELLAAAMPVGPSPDLIAIGPDSITYRAMRAIGFTCQLGAATFDITVRASSYVTSRTITTADSLLLYVENKPNTAGDDIWIHAGLTQASVAQNCPDGTAGVRFRLSPLSAVAYPGLGVATVFGKMVLGGPVRGFEVMQMRTYPAGGDTWLGMRSLTSGGALQPVLGPLSDNAAAIPGMALRFRDAANATTAVPNNVRAVEVTLRGITDAPVHRSGYGYAAVDSLSLTTRVALRNALRP